MRKILFGIFLTLSVLYLIHRCATTNTSSSSQLNSKVVLEQQIKNVGKLVVTEGHYSEVFTYKNAKELLGSLLTSEKKALVVVNAKVTVAYNLELLEYTLDETTKTLTLTKIPEAEITVYPELEFYDVQADFFNPFEAQDYNQIQEQVKNNLQEKIKTTSLKSNAENRLISELSKFYILTEALGWTLKYNQNTIKSQQQWNALAL